MARLMNLANSDIDSDYNLKDYDARDATGDKLGDVDSVIVDSDTMQPRYLVIDSGGWFSSNKYVVPMGEVDHVDDNEKNVYFRSLTKDQLKNGAYPEYDESWWDTNNGQAFGNYEQRVANAYDTRAVSGSTAAGRAMADQGRQGMIDYNSDLYRRPTENAGRLQLLEEHLIANKERYQAGTVKLGKHVIERQETINVPVTEERVVVDRQPVANAQPVDRKLGDDQTIEATVTRERVNVEKEVVPTEEVGLRKETVQRNERAQGTVRKEELDVQDDQGLTRDGGTADREGATPNPALRNRADMTTSANANEGRFPNDEERARASAAAARRRAAEEGPNDLHADRSAIDSARSDKPGAP